jgi:hypothetical protein
MTKPRMSKGHLERDAEREELRTNDGEMGFPIVVCGGSLVILVPLPHEKLSDSVEYDMLSEQDQLGSLPLELMI